MALCLKTRYSQRSAPPACAAVGCWLATALPMLQHSTARHSMVSHTNTIWQHPHHVAKLHAGMHIQLVQSAIARCQASRSGCTCPQCCMCHQQWYACACHAQLLTLAQICEAILAQVQQAQACHVANRVRQGARNVVAPQIQVLQSCRQQTS